MTIQTDRRVGVVLRTQPAVGAALVLRDHLGVANTAVDLAIDRLAGPLERGADPDVALRAGLVPMRIAGHGCPVHVERDRLPVPLHRQ